MNSKSVEVKVLHVGCSFHYDITDEICFGVVWGNIELIVTQLRYTSQYIPYIHTYRHKYGKVKKSFYRPRGFQEFEPSTLLDNGHMKVVRLSDLSTGCPYPPVNISGTCFW